VISRPTLRGSQHNLERRGREIPPRGPDRARLLGRYKFRRLRMVAKRGSLRRVSICGSTFR
jgi:hypothetical protein